MSAYIVDDRTINTILAFVRGEYARPNSRFNWLGHMLSNADYKPGTHEGVAAFGQALYNLNVRGVEARYGKGKAFGELGPLDYQYEYMRNPGYLKAYEAMRELYYQSDNDGMADDPVLILLRSMQNFVARAVLEGTPEYVRMMDPRQREAEQMFDRIRSKRFTVSVQGVPEGLYAVESLSGDPEAPVTVRNVKTGLRINLKLDAVLGYVREAREKCEVIAAGLERIFGTKDVGS